MGQRRQEEVPLIPNWSELCPDLLSFISLNRAKLVCSSWHTASRGCVPKKNQIPWLILFPRDNNNSSSCVVFVPEDKEKVYKTRDLRIDFFSSHCLATYGSWLLMANRFCNNIYIINHLTCERIDLPDTKSPNPLYSTRASFWIDIITKEYLVFLKKIDSSVFTKKGVNKWHELPLAWYEQIVYNHKNQKLYLYHHVNSIKIWDFSGDNKPRDEGFLNCRWVNIYDGCRITLIERRLVFTISGDVLIVSCRRVEDYDTWRFGIYKANHLKRKWVTIDSLGDEALILDMGITILAKDIPGIKRNSIYFNGVVGRKNPEDIFVFDLTTQNIEPLPQCVLSSIQFSQARWFFPGFNGYSSL